MELEATDGTELSRRLAESKSKETAITELDSIELIELKVIELGIIELETAEHDVIVRRTEKST